MKQWKDGDKFSGNDYTSERNVIKDTVISKSSEASEKNQKRFILSETAPQDVLTDTVWLDSTNTFLIIVKKLLQIAIESSSEVSAVDSYQRNITAQTTSQADLEASIFVPAVETITKSTFSESLIGADAQQNLSEPIVTSTSSAYNIGADAQASLSEEVSVSTSSNYNIDADAQQNLNEAIITATSSDENIDADAQQNLSEAITTSTSSQENIDADAQQSLSESVTTSTSSSHLISAESQTETDASVTETVSSLGDIDADIQQDVSESIPNTITSVEDVEAEQSSNLSDTFNFTFNSSVDIEGIQTSNIVESMPNTITSTSDVDGFLTLSNTAQNVSYPITSISDIDATSTINPTFLVQSRVFGGPSVTITASFSDTGSSNYTLPENSTLVTLRSSTPNDVTITLTAPASVDYNGSTWSFSKWRFNSTGAESTNRTVADVVNSDEIYEVYYAEIVEQPVWNITVVQSYSTTFTVFSSSIGDSAVVAAVTAAYPPQNYTVGYVARVQVYDPDTFSFLGTRYVVRGVS